LLAGILSMGTYAMLEFPHAYVYFLIPLGLMIGAVDGLSPARAWSAAMPRVAHGSLLACAAFVAAVIAIDYVRVDRDLRDMRLSYMGLAPRKSPDEATRVIVLDHLRAFLVLARTSTSANLTEEQVASLRRTVRRFPHPPLLVRYAVIAARHGDVAGARDSMDRLCRLHSELLCANGFREWAIFTSDEPALKAIDFN
jgi:hypothetical protein